MKAIDSLLEGVNIYNLAIRRDTSVAELVNDFIRVNDIDITYKMKSRGKDSSVKQRLSFNSNSDIYYLDFIELGDIIKENWADFKSYFLD